MSNRVYLHMGAHKTGTSSLQAAMSENRSALLSLGLMYPKFSNDNSHYKWARFIAGEMPNITSEQHQQVTTSWLKSLEQQQALLLSAESMYRHINAQPDYLAKLHAIFLQKEITPVLCFRRQGEYAKSLYSEWVMFWQYQHDIYTFIREFYNWFDFEGVTHRVSILGKPVVMSYHQIGGPDICSKFLKELGYELKFAEGKSCYKRVSLSDAEVYLKRLLNKVYPQPEYRALTTETVKKVVSTNYPELVTPLPDLIWSGKLDPATFERSYKMSNIRLMKQCGLDLECFFPQIEYHHSKKISKQIMSMLERAYSEALKSVGAVLQNKTV
jgi:hypothetical protein